MAVRRADGAQSLRRVRCECASNASQRPVYRRLGRGTHLASPIGHMTRDVPVTMRGGTFLGSGLSMPAYGAVLVASVALFVWWGGPLWSASGSHGTRFAVSYLAVVPFAAAALAIARALSWIRLANTIG